VAIDEAQIQHEKERLPRGWGRFGKALEHLPELADADESLLCTCIGVNPDFRMTHGILEPGSPAALFASAIKDTNLLLAATDRRVIALATGLRGDPREHHTYIPYAGLEIVSVGKKDLSLRWPEGSLEIRGIAKSALPEFVETLRSQALEPRA
jgi:hypothetical protein